MLERVAINFRTSTLSGGLTVNASNVVVMLATSAVTLTFGQTAIFAATVGTSGVRRSQTQTECALTGVDGLLDTGVGSDTINRGRVSMITDRSKIDQVLASIRGLSPQEQLDLLEHIAGLLRASLRAQSKHSVLELEGLGAEIWRGVDSQENACTFPRL